MGVQRSTKRAGGQRGAEKQSGLVLKALKGGILGLVITIMSILAFAILVKKFGISDEVISAVNQAVKVASIFMAAYASSKNSTQRQILTGAAAGCMYVLLGYLTFSLIQSSSGRCDAAFGGFGDGRRRGHADCHDFYQNFKIRKSQRKTRMSVFLPANCIY